MEEISGTDNWNALIDFNSTQMLIAGNNEICLSLSGTGQDVIIGGIVFDDVGNGALQQEKHQSVNADYRVGLVSLGVSVDEFERIQKEILAEGYRQHDLNVHLTQRTSWLATRPTVLYYDRQSESMAKTLVEKMEKLTGLKFFIQRGVGLGVTKGEESSTLFVHYMRELG